MQQFSYHFLSLHLRLRNFLNHLEQSDLHISFVQKHNGTLVYYINDAPIALTNFLQYNCIHHIAKIAVTRIKLSQNNQHVLFVQATKVKKMPPYFSIRMIYPVVDMKTKLTSVTLRSLCVKNDMLCCSVHRVYQHENLSFFFFVFLLACSQCVAMVSCPYNTLPCVLVLF